MHGDCLELMKTIPDNSIDMVLTDPPYGTTVCKWDTVIDFELMWKELKRITKDNSAICLFGGNPFQSNLIMSNPKMFRYEWIWDKKVGSNFSVLKYQPIRAHESISVFSTKSHRYYPIKEPRTGSGKKRLINGYKSDSLAGDACLIKNVTRKGKIYDELKNPSSIQYFNPRDKDRGFHPTQKPVALLEYLIKTYTLENETVLDFTMGSGSTGVACKSLTRKFIGIELDDKYFNIAKDRINANL